MLPRSKNVKWRLFKPGRFESSTNRMGSKVSTQKGEYFKYNLEFKKLLFSLEHYPYRHQEIDILLININIIDLIVQKSRPANIKLIVRTMAALNLHFCKLDGRKAATNQLQTANRILESIQKQFDESALEYAYSCIQQYNYLI